MTGPVAGITKIPCIAGKNALISSMGVRCGLKITRYPLSATEGYIFRVSGCLIQVENGVSIFGMADYVAMNHLLALRKSRVPGQVRMNCPVGKVRR